MEEKEQMRLGRPVVRVQQKEGALMKGLSWARQSRAEDGWMDG